MSNTAAAEVSASRAARQREWDSEGARPLGEKRALLHAQRQRADKVRFVARPVAGNDGALLLRTEDGAVAFVLRSATSGLMVERTQRRSLGACLVQTLLFTEHEAFARWCGADTVRFDEPVLYDRLRREGDVFLDCKR
ncbi:MAG: hypothetical protein AD742_20295 [Methylibium sp. NZG]|nr:MAG: hypothetical protein AD742_20295 [Methylibium sp. NZG]